MFIIISVKKQIFFLLWLLNVRSINFHGSNAWPGFRDHLFSGITLPFPVGRPLIQTVFWLFKKLFCPMLGNVNAPLLLCDRFTSLMFLTLKYLTFLCYVYLLLLDMLHFLKLHWLQANAESTAKDTVYVMYLAALNC